MSLTEKLSMLSAQPVIFKLLATLRLAVDGSQEAAGLIGKKRGHVAKLVEWGTSDAQALRSEAARLLAALIKHSKSEEVI